MADLWQQIETHWSQDPPVHLDADDECYRAREYVAHGGYSASEANQLIFNFKKPIDRKGKPEWRYKVKAARQFAQEIVEVVNDDVAIATIPTSKCPTDPAYDPRFDMLLEEISRLTSDLSITAPIVRETTIQPSHDGGDRNAARIQAGLQWQGFDDAAPDILVLIDDVITTGSSFKACKSMVRSHYDDTMVVGLFWARCIWTAESHGF